MDRYPFGLQQYRAAKLRIYENAKVCVVNADDALTMPIRGADERCVSFGVNMGDYHLNHQQGETWLRVKGEKVLNVKEMKLPGSITTPMRWRRWRWQMLQVTACQQPESVNHITGLPHRFEVVLEHNGVRWINDSKATNVGSTEAALNGLHVDGTLHLLLGGDGKSADFSPLARYLNGDNVRLYCSVVTARSWRRYARKWQNKPKLWNRRCACWLRVFSRAIWFCSPQPVPALISQEL